MIENIRLLYNKIRIRLLSIFTDRVKHIEIKTPDGKVHRATVEKQYETVPVPDEKLKRVSNILYQSETDPDVYYIIPYKVEVKHEELFTWMDDIAKHFKVKFDDLIEKPADEKS